MSRNKIKTGVCSITFRQHSIAELVALVGKAGLDAIEWGGDVHVPLGDAVAAQEARRLTQEAGLEVSSYGSYYRVLDAAGDAVPFEPVLQTALELGTGTIRIWADSQGSEVCDPARLAKFTEALRIALDAARKQDVRLAVEFHGNTLADSNFATKTLLDGIDHPNLYTYWQPMYWVADPDYRFQGLELLSGRILNLHVFHWLFRPFVGGWGENTDRRPLSEGAAEWRAYLSAKLDPTIEHFALLEFVRQDSPEQFLSDAVVLKEMLAG